MASSPPSQQAAGGNPPPPAPDPVVVEQFEQGGGENAAEEAQEMVAFAPRNQDVISTFPREILFHKITSFLSPKDRLSFFTTSRTLLMEVELFSQEALEKYRERADDTWWDRISNQDSIETERPRPLVLPSRYLLAKALKTHLYTLNVWDFPCLTPDGKKLVGKLGGGIVSWDLQTKERRVVREDVRVVGKGTPFALLDHVVVSVEDLPDAQGGLAIAVRDFAGEPLRYVPFPNIYKITLFGANDTKVFYSSSKFPDSVSCMDLGTGGCQEQVVTMVEIDKCNKVVVLGDSLVVIGAFGGTVEEPQQGGIHVFSANDFRRTHFVPGNFVSVAKPTVSTGETTIVAINASHPESDEVFFHVFDLTNGRLAERISFPRDGRKYDKLPLFIQAHQSFVYVRDFNSHGMDNAVEAYSISSGELLQTFDFTIPNRCSAMMTNGNEIFFSPHRHVYAFPLETT